MSALERLRVRRTPPMDVVPTDALDRLPALPSRRLLRRRHLEGESP